MVRTGKIRKLMEDYNAITDGRKKKVKRSLAGQIFALVEARARSPLHNYFFLDKGSNHIVEYIIWKVEVKHGVKGLRKLWEDRENTKKAQLDYELRYDANLVPITRDLNIGDILVDEEDCDEWVIIAKVGNHGWRLKKRKGRKEIEIETSCGKQWWEVEECDGENNPNFEPIYFLSMFADPKFV